MCVLGYSVYNSRFYWTAAERISLGGSAKGVNPDRGR